MTDAPERIWKADNTHPDGTREYIRADISPSPEVVKELVEALRKVPSALNSAFAAGTEEREGGSARRQAKALGDVDALRREVLAILAKLEGVE